MNIGLPVQTVHNALAAASDRADRLGVRVCIAIVDASGDLGGFVRAPGAFLASTGIAMDKAWTAASFGIDTRSFSRFLEGEERCVRDGLLRRGRVCEVPGGFPIRDGDNLLGAIGVSGGSAEQDEEIALASMAAFDPSHNRANQPEGEA